MIVHLDPSSALPPYAQVTAQVATMIRSGVLAPGTRLPPIRQLARDLGLAVNTVARAYRELEEQGLVATRGRNGTVVAAPPPAALRSPIDDEATTFALAALHRGVDLDGAVDAVRRAYARLDPASAAG